MLGSDFLLNFEVKDKKEEYFMGLSHVYTEI